MKWVVAFVGLAFIGAVGGQLLHERSLEKARLAELALAQEVAARCRLPRDHVRLLRDVGINRPSIELSGFFFDPSTGEKDVALTCFETEMRRKRLSFSDQTNRGYPGWEHPVP